MAEQIGRYTVVEELRRGGMARTLLCRAPDQRLVVVKQPLERDLALAQRLRDEFRVGRRLRHPHLVETLDLVDHEGGQAIVLSYFKGVPLADLRGLAVPPAAVARIGAQIAQALAALHGASDDDGRSLGVVHRDLSSGNILVGASGDACLIDLGIARWDEVRSAHTETGALIGTVRYFAPELLEQGGYTPASDVWALGCCLIELMRGSALFSGRTQDVLLALARYRSPVDVEGLDTDTPLGAVLGAMLARDPTDRPDAASVAARLAEVEGALGGGRADLADLASRMIASNRARRATAPSSTSPPTSSSSTSSTSPTAATLPARPSAMLSAPSARGIAAGIGAAVVAAGAVVFAFRSATVTDPPATSVATPVTTTSSVAAAVSASASALPVPSRSVAPAPVTETPAAPTEPGMPPTRLPPRLDASLVPLPPGSPPGRSDGIDAVRELVVRGDPREALRALQAIEQRTPDDPRLHRSYGIVYERLGDIPRSREAFARFIALAPDHPDVPRIRRRLGL